MNQKHLDEAALFRAIGEIDDSIVSEAIAYRAPKRKHRAELISILSAVAAIFLICILAFRIFPNVTDPGTNPSSPTVLWSITDGYESNTSLIACLAELRSTSEASYTAPRTDTGDAMVVFREEATGIYYSVQLTDATSRELSKLTRMLRDNSPATSIAADSEAPPFSVWILTGNGIAFSPYLPYESGTVFFGLPADYAPEHLPSESFAAYLESLIRSSTD